MSYCSSSLNIIACSSSNISKYYDRLDAVAKALLEKEHLNREEFEAIMKGEDILSEKVEEIVEEKTTEDTLQNQ